MTTSIHEATPLQVEAREQHKARLARIADRAIDKPKPPEPVSPEVGIPTTEPKPYKPWFSIAGEVTVEEVKHAVATAVGMTRQDLESARKTDNLVRPRQIAMYLADMLTSRSLSYIGHRFGDRDHSTVHHAVRKIERLVKIDAELARQIEAIKEKITS